jgi:hypothetical protein
MSQTTALQVRYQLHDEQLAEHQRRLDSAFDLLLEEVLRMRSSVVHHRGGLGDSTPAGGQE